MSDTITQAGRILKLLKSKPSVTNNELNRICMRYSARIKDLRDEGHNIVSTHVKGPLWEFTLAGEPTTDN